MFLGLYRFSGKADAMLAGYERMMKQVPPGAIHLHVCVQDAEGLSVYDSCPSREVFEEFANSGQFHDMVATAGLPNPTVTLLGDVHSAWFEGNRLR